MIRAYRRQNIGARRWRGSQPTLWRAFNPGTERAAALGEFRNPTTTERFAKFVPLLAARLGNNTGVPLGMNLTSPGLRDVVLLDLLGAPDRENPANLVICGSPGRGKSHIGKLLIRSWLALGAGVHIFDPGEPREHQRALADVDDLVVIDLADPGMSIDPLRIFAVRRRRRARRGSPAAAAGVCGDEQAGRAAAQPPGCGDARRQRDWQPGAS